MILCFSRTPADEQCAVWRDLRASDDAADADEGGGGRGACMDLIEIERAARTPINLKQT